MKHLLLFKTLETLWQQPYTSDYEKMIFIRAWVNESFPDFELYLEDVWDEYKSGETWITYILRCKKTLNETDPLAFDKYTNHRDAKGVWHLGDYYESEICIKDATPIIEFIQTETEKLLPKES